MTEIEITIKNNCENAKNSQSLKIRITDNFNDILTKIGLILNISAKLIYTENGAVIDDLNDIKNGETLYISQGEPFRIIKNEPKKTVPIIIKIGVVGGNYVGKTALISRFVQKTFVDEYVPTYENLIRKRINLCKESIIVDITDTNGIEEYTGLQKLWYESNEAFIMVYSIDDRRSFERLKEIYNDLIACKKTALIPLIVIGSKSDIKSKRAVQIGRAHV